MPEVAEATLREALAGLVKRLDEIQANPSFKDVWTSYHIHGGRYDGPTWVEALTYARAVLEVTADG